MIRKVLGLLIILIVSPSASDFEEQVIWKYHFAGSLESYGSYSAFSNGGLESIFLHTKPYAINSLGWSFAALSYAKNKYAVGFDFNTFGLDNLYRRNRYAIRGEYEFVEHFRLASVLKIRTERFNNFGNYTGTNTDIYLKYNRNSLMTGFGITDYWIKTPYDLINDEKIKPTAFASYSYNDDLLFSIAVRRFENRRTRWLFDQRLILSGAAGLNFGYMNNPGCLYGGLNLTVKPISFILNYYSVGGLSDTIIWGISFRE